MHGFRQLTRRSLIRGGVAALITGTTWPMVAAAQDAHGRLAALEAELGGRIGVAAVNTGTGHRVAYRGGERFGSDVKAGKEIAPLRQVTAHLGHRIGFAPLPVIAAIGQCRLFARERAIEPQQSLTDAGKRRGKVGDFEGRQIDIVEDRIAQHFGQATGMIGAGQRAVLEAPPELRSEAALAAHQAAMRRR